MSDYLGRLVQRSLAPATDGLLAPRLPSLFEAPGGDISAPEVASEKSVDVPGVKPRPRTETEASPTVVSNVQSSTLRLQAALSVSGTPHQPNITGEQKVAKPASTDRRLLTTQIIRHEPALTAQPLAAESVSKAEAASPSSPLQPEVPVRLRLSPVEPLPVTRQSRRAENVAAVSEQPSGTTVRINIGRIEVRAVHPSQPGAPPRRPLPQPKLSIEEYARQRNEGKR